MDDMARSEYPAMLSHLQPGQAVQTLNDRVRRINKLNLEIADWLQERRRIEEQYVMGLRKLGQLKTPAVHSELGVFQSPWMRIIDAVERIAQSHHAFAERLERDVEEPLRVFQQRSDYHNMHNMSSNLGSLAKDMEGAQDKTEKLNKKGIKASTDKVDAASSKLESATQQWESQAPFVFESLQALDESRINHLRDVLTQYQTHEADQSQRVQDIAAQTLAVMLEIHTDKEIQDFVQSTTAGKPAAPRRSSTARSSVAGTQSAEQPPLPRADTNHSTASAAPPSRASETHPEDVFDTLPPPPVEQPKGSKLRRLGTIFGGRKRQSVVGGFGQSPGKGSGRAGSRDGRGGPPQTSSMDNRLESLAETPDAPPQLGRIGSIGENDGTNGSTPAATNGAPNGTQGSDLVDVAPPAGPPPGQAEKAGEVAKDEEGFTVRAPMNDPISEAQKEAAGDDADQLFKLSIQNKPVEDEDPEAKLAALSSVANSLKTGPANRRTSTIRGRRDVRNTIYVPPPANTGQTDGSLPAISASPPLSGPESSSSFARPPALQALASEASVAGTSDSQSVRSGHSLGSLVHAQHPEMTGPGLQSSIIETVSATFEEGEVKSVSIAGELAFKNNDTTGEKTHETIKINNYASLEKIGPNRIFVQNASPDQPDQYALDLSQLAKTSIGFSYRVFADDSDATALGKHAPLVLKPAWKPQDDKLGVLLQYHLNPSSELAGPVTLHNVVFVVRYEGRATAVQTKPSGTHLKDKHLVYWRIGDVTLTSDVQKIVCRIVGADGVCPTQSHVEARWEYTAAADQVVGSGISVSRLDKGKGKEMYDPFADISQTWQDVPMARKLAGGKYEGS